MSEQQNTPADSPILDDRYRLISGLSHDLGTAYQAYDMEQDRQVNLLLLAARWGTGAETLDRLQRAQRIVQSLGAPGLVPVEEIGLAGEQVYLVSTLPHDATLADLLQAGPPEVGLAVWIAIHLCEALAPAHRAGLAHGGLAPQSVLVGQPTGADPYSSLAVHLLDTGLLPALQAASQGLGQPWGRIPYLSPEQVAGEPVRPASDVYVIGSLLYEMLAGRPPFRSTDNTVLAMKHLKQEPPALQVLSPEIPSALDQIVRKAMAKEPAARYRNAGQLAQILKTQVAAKLPAPKPEGEPASPVPGPAEGHQRLVVPPPPAPALTSSWPVSDVYHLEGNEDWLEESTGVDWLMVALFVAALIAVLGLIPLWRAVYRQYAAPSSSLVPGAQYRVGQDILLYPHGAQIPPDEIHGQEELGTFGFVWYNPIQGNSDIAPLTVLGGTGRSDLERDADSLCFGSPAYGSRKQNVVHCGKSVVEA